MLDPVFLLNWINQLQNQSNGTEWVGYQQLRTTPGKEKSRSVNHYSFYFELIKMIHCAAELPLDASPRGAEAERMQL
jgi:hypothetical protein